MYTTALEMLILEVQGKAVQHSDGIVFPYSVRLSPRQHSMAEAMATRAGVSRNNMINQLIDVGIDAVLPGLPDDVREDLEHEAGDIICAALKKKSYDVADSREDQE